MNKWQMKQLNVTNAFIHGNMTEELYIAQPQGYVNPAHSHHVCKLHRSIYGLKQAPRAWFARLTSFLHSLHFISSKADTSLFILHQNTDIIFLLVYVNDIILTGSNAALIQQFIHYLQREFLIRDLGALHYFLGIEL